MWNAYKRGVLRGKRILHPAVLTKREADEWMPNGSFYMETKPEALVSEGCVSAHLVFKTVSVVTEQTRSDKGSTRKRAQKAYWWLAYAYVGWRKVA